MSSTPSSEKLTESVRGDPHRIRVFSAAIQAFSAAGTNEATLGNTIASVIADVVGGACTVSLGAVDGPVSSTYAHGLTTDADARQPVALVVPMYAGRQTIGTIRVTRPGEDAAPLDADDLVMAQCLADHAAIAIAYAQSVARDRAVLARSPGATRFSRLSESGIIGILVVEDQRATEVNDTLLDLLGYGRDEILSGAIAWRDVTPIEWRSADEHAWKQLETTGVSGLREKQYLHKDGTRIPVLVGAARCDEPTRESICFVLDLRGSTRMADAIEKLRLAQASEATFRGFLESVPDAVVIKDSDGKIVLVNSQTETMFGRTREELVGRPAEMLIPERLRGSGADHDQLGFAVWAVRSDGTEFPVEISVGPVQTEDGLLVSSTIRDITERMKSEAQRFRLAAIVECSADAIIGQTLDGIITSWNDGAHRMFGYSAEQMVGGTLARLLPPDRSREEGAILERLSHGNRVESFDTVRLRQDGSAVEVSVSSSLTRDVSGAIIGASKVVRDISARRVAEVAMARARDHAEASSQELEAFSYSVAHDLRAPLRGMNGFAQLLVSTYADKLDEEGRDWLSEILLNARKMAALIDALLSLARLTRSDLRREAVDLSACVRDILVDLAVAEPGRKLDLVVPTGLTAKLDPDLARVLLENLVGNAWKFTSKVPLARIELGVMAALDRDGPVFFVRDNGAGFDMAFADKLFGPFQRLHTVDEFTGTGIGLATVQRIVSRHGGHVWAESAVNRGATFYFSFPDRTAGALQ